MLLLKLIVNLIPSVVEILYRILNSFLENIPSRTLQDLHRCLPGLHSVCGIRITTDTAVVDVRLFGGLGRFKWFLP